ncbi:MAG: hypothetical protein CMD31_12935 [Flavobacteriales bacterium]|nr:hypothetical protein [Flavobacteriales bacterium]|tara:strand:+ start:1713 stop:7535 length:5823 start_codon:yes stop_codon:yes gene_type:complete
MNNKSMFARIRKSKTIKLIMAFAAINLLVEIAFPTVAMALTAGSASPEFSSFEPVATTDMVNDFTGDFTYNLPVLSVPGPDGGGYSMSLSYHSGVSSEEEASWVGFGWTLNPGAINRQKRGYADDFNNVPVTKYNKTTPNWTQLAAFDFNMEYNSADNPKDTSSAVTNKVKKLFLDKNGNNAPNGFGSGEVGISFSKSIRYNNYSGFNIVNGFGVSSKGMASLNMNRSAGETTLGFSVNPMAVVQKLTNKLNKDVKVASLKSYVEQKKKFRSKIITTNIKLKNNLSSNYSSWSFNAPAVGYSVAQNSGKATNFSASLQINPAGPIGFQGGIKGSMNYQITEPLVNTKAYGYMYNPQGNPEAIDASNKEVLESDFQIEKPSTFNKHDRNLGIPFNNADIFAATGNGVIGGFKLYHNQVGHYYPPFVENNQKISQLGVEVGIGGTISVGFDFGLGFQQTKVGDWRAVEEDFDYNNTPPYLRFNGDMGGQIDYSDNDQPLTATIGGAYMNRKLDLGNFKDGNAGVKAKLDNTKSGRTSFIEYEKTGSLITAMVVTNKDGNKSTYGEPVYVHEETELTIGLKNNVFVEATGTNLAPILNDGDATPAQYVINHELEFSNPTLNKTAVGQRVESPYVSTYLLTSNTTFDYLDISGDGPSEDDFGGWTKFDYRQVHNDYRYRAPYKGLFYDRGRLFDGDDQTGSMSSGVKDVKYLKSVETKTHIAFFVTNKTQTSDFDATYSSLDLTGSMNDRFDGLDAADISSGLDLASTGSVGNKKLEKLERIVLYAKNDLSKPISTTYFEYDYALVQGIPNTSGSANQKGKLTLKKVWTESGGTIKSRIAPYQFEYEYFTDYSSEIITKYPNLLDGIAQLTKGTTASPTSNQNPVYQEGQLDMWGNYRFDGKDRFEKIQPWVNQKENPVSFDPAAWQLKRIILPSGGEIHVQYEQKDYRFVQDQKAMVMTSLTNHTDFNNGYDTYDDIALGLEKNKYFINLESLGLDPLDPDYTQQVTNYVNTLTEHFVTLKNKLYYKILYSYRANYIPNLHHFNHRYDYVTGYTTVNEVNLDPVTNKIYLSLGNAGEEDKTIPRWVGFQKLHQQADRNLGWDAHNMEIDDRSILNKAYQTSGAITSDINKIGKDYTLSNTFNLFGNWVAGDVKNYPKDKACKTLNVDLSYFKLPAFHAKKGGGIRVKRLLSYDPGIARETGDAMVYGSEYSYKNSDGTSSGVATNEPQQGREESPLTTIVERNKQSGWNKMLNGRDSKEQEGPLGESLLPGASVVHERVIIKNIHSGKTTTGYAVNKYHTTRSFPMQVDFTEISKDGDSPTYKKYNLNLPLGLFNMSVNRAWVTQGYLFKLNDMHGKPESQATYSGTYHPNLFNEAAYTSKTTYQYTKPGTAIKSLVYDSGTQDFTIGLMKPGQEEDLTMYRSKVTDRTNDFSIELDLNITLPTPITLGFGVSYTYSDDQLSQHVTSKVIRQKTYLLSTTTTTDGVTQTTENLAFDKNTGDPVLTKTYDGYYAVDEQINTEGDLGKHNGEYYALNVPASWVYAEVGRKSDLVTNSNQLTASVGNIVTYGENVLVDPSTGKAKTTSANPISGIFTNVVNASATVYKKGWFNTNVNQAALEANFPFLSTPTTLTALNNNYYPRRTYVYRDQVTNANNGARIYGGGVITDPLNMFDWANGDFSQKELGKWYSASEIISYSPHGYPVQETDVLNISSTAHFGYNNTLPVLVAQNAAYSEVNFIDFEYGFNNNANINNNYAHSGAKSYDVSLDKNYVFIQNYPITSQIIATKGLSIKLWLKSSLSNNPSSPNYGLKNSTPDLKALIGGQQFNFKRIAQTGEWSLYVVEIRNFNGLAAGTYNIQLGYNYLPNEMVLVDDFRIQPLDAVMNCTVYTIDNKVAAQFDDQHFGVYYEYNNKGQLVRKSIETERGKKTLQEQQYNTPLILRTN